MTAQEGARHKEETVIVLDFLPNGYPFDSRPGQRKLPVVQAVGKERFTLLELAPKKEVFLQPHEEVYIGEDKRDKIHHIIGRLSPERITTTAKAELEVVIRGAIKRNEKKFVEFFNTSRPLTTRMHQLELLPGMGKKHMWEIIEKRQDRPFESFADLKKRIHLMPDPEKILIKRILLEITGNEKHRIFATT